MGAVAGFLALERQVQDVERAIDFYVRGLGFAVVSVGLPGDPQAQAELRLGSECIVLRRVHSAVGPAARVAGPDVRFQHVAVVTRNMAAAFQQLQTLAPEPISLAGPQRLPAASGGATAFKFRDPDGHPLELIEFSRRPDRWRGHAGHGPNLGLDHAAISVSKAEESIAFYDRLGFSVVARQVNSGREQALLDGLDGTDDVNVQVVALSPGGKAGFHIELLAYRVPPAVTPALENLRQVDAWADRLAWRGFSQASRLADPDGHLLDLIA